MEADKIIVTTGDLKCDYDIIGPVYFQISNKGLFTSQLSVLIKKYKEYLEPLKKNKSIQEGRNLDWGFLWGEFSVGQSDFDMAFYIAVQELKRRALVVNGDAIISMKQDIDLDTVNFQSFYLQMYGTAVKIK